MNGEYLLDTSVLIPLLRSDEVVLQRLAGAQRVLVPCIALGELYVGAIHGGDGPASVAEVDELAMNVPVLVCDGIIARSYGVLKAALLRKGTPVPDNDIWIAAIAMRHGLCVATRDQHFLRIEGLAVEVW